MEEFNAAALGKRSVKGVFALVSRTFLLNIISYGVSLIIFTVLSPKDFGVYIAAIAGQRIISFFTDFGLGAALVQKRESLEENDLKTAFSIQMLLTFMVFVATLFLRGQISSFFKLGEDAERLFLVLVFSIFLSSFKVVPSILLERKVHFQKLIIPQIVESLVFNMILVILVLRGFGIDSYTWAFLISGIIGIPFYYLVSPWKIRLGITRKSLISLRFGIQFQAKNILATIKDDALTLFLAKTLSFVELGYIGFGQRNAFFAYRFIVDNVTKVTFSTFARIQDDTQLLKIAIEKSLFLVSAIIFPLLFGLITVAPYVIYHFPRWQQKWEPAILSLIFFSLNALVSSLSGILVNVLDATGRVKLTLRLMIMWTVLTWTITPLGIYFFGYSGVAIASFIVTLTIGVTIYFVKEIVNFNFLKSIDKPFLCSLGMSIFVFFAARFYAKDLLSTSIIIMIGGIIYLLSMYLLVGKQVKKDLALVLKKT